MCTQYMHSVHACFKIPKTEDDKNTVIKSCYKILEKIHIRKFVNFRF